MNNGRISDLNPKLVKSYEFGDEHKEHKPINSKENPEKYHKSPNQMTYPVKTHKINLKQLKISRKTYFSDQKCIKQIEGK